MAQALGEQVRHEEERQVRTMCRLCLNRCGILATVRRGMVVRIDGDLPTPITKARPVPRAARDSTRSFPPIVLPVR